MTSIQLASLCARNLKQPDITLMPMLALRDVVTAMNAAMQEFYSRMPAIHKRTTVSDTLRAPETVSFDIAGRYQNERLNEAFTAAMRGCTVLMGNDPYYNEIVSTNAVLDAYTGTTLLGGTATVYRDAVPVPDVFERISSPVRLFNGQSITELIRQEDKRLCPHQVGKPKYYFIEACGSSQGADPEFIVRVHPMPDADYKIRFEVELSTYRVTLVQASREAVNLPVNDRYCESILVPLAEAELLTSPHWGDRSLANLVLSRAERAREAFERVPQLVDPGGNEIGTEEGW